MLDQVVSSQWVRIYRCSPDFFVNPNHAQSQFKTSTANKSTRLALGRTANHCLITILERNPRSDTGDLCFLFVDLEFGVRVGRGRRRAGTEGPYNCVGGSPRAGGHSSNINRMDCQVLFLSSCRVLRWNLKLMTASSLVFKKS